MKAWAVTMTQIWSSLIKGPGCPSSVRINILREVPTIPDQAPNTNYNLMFIGPCIIAIVDE